MPFNIETFKSRGVPLGGARPTLFQVNLVVPTGAGGAAAMSNIAFQCSAASLPPSVIDEIRVPYFGRYIKLAGDRTFQDWQITVYNDEQFTVRDSLERWHNLINAMVSNIQDDSVAGPIGSTTIGSTEATYKADLRVDQFAKPGPSDLPSREYFIIGAFPNEIGPIRLGWGETNRIEEFDVRFSYDYWIPAGPTAAAWGNQPGESAQAPAGT